MVDLPGQFNGFKEEAMQLVEKVFDESKFINGPQVAQFADNLASYLNANHVIPCANGTDALQIALMALDLPQGSEVIVPSYNYVAAAEMIPLLGLVPVFIDSDFDHFNVDEQKIQEAITAKTKAIVAVHLFGQACKMEPIMAIAKENGLYVIEDNAQSIGGEYSFSNGETVKLGTIGDIATTSFFPSKNLGCYGDGGAVFTNNDELAKKARMYGNHGQRSKYIYDLVGINSRLDTIQAGLLDIKLKRLDSFIDARRKAADFYDEGLKAVDWIATPYRLPEAKHVFHQYTLKTNNGRRDELRDYLSEKGIPSMIYYPVPIHENLAYQDFPKKDLSNAEALSRQVISLPMHTELEEDQLEFIVNSVKDFA